MNLEPYRNAFTMPQLLEELGRSVNGTGMILWRSMVEPVFCIIPVKISSIKSSVGAPQNLGKHRGARGESPRIPLVCPDFLKPGTHPVLRGVPYWMW